MVPNKGQLGSNRGWMEGLGIDIDVNILVNAEVVGFDSD